MACSAFLACLDRALHRPFRQLHFKKRLGLYGQLFDSGVGIAGVVICFFWLFTAIFAARIAPYDPLAQIPIMKDALPGAIVPDGGGIYYFGADKLRATSSRAWCSAARSC